MKKEPITIAILDDHTLYRDALKNLVLKSGLYKVIIEAANGKEYLKKQKQSPNPDIILLDISMPVMDGFETILWITHNIDSAKVIVLSAFNDIGSILQMQKMGANGYLHKSATGDEIHFTLNKVYNEGSYFPDSTVKAMKTSMQKSVSDNITSLTDRQLSFLRYICTDLSYDQIAEKMKISRYTIDDYCKILFKKFSVESRAGLMLTTLKNKIVEL